MSDIRTLLQDAWLGNLPSLGYLQGPAQLTNAEAAALCGVAPETYRRWRTDRTPPLYAFRLLAIMAGYLPWSGWQTCYLNPHEQQLYIDDDRYGFSRQQLRVYWFEQHALSKLRADYQKLRQNHAQCWPLDLTTAVNDEVA